MTEALDVLAATRSIEFAAATNLKGEVAGATWRYLLPSIERPRVLVIGPIDPATVDALLQGSSEVVVATGRPTGPGPRLAVGGRAARPPPSAVETVPRDGLEAWLRARPDGSLDLVVLTGRQPEGIKHELDRLLRPAGAVVREGAPDHGQARPATADRRTVRIAVRPDRGEIRSAVGADDETSARMLAGRRLAGPAIRLPGPRRLASVAGRLLGPRARTLELELPADGATLPDPPAYLAALADAAGIDIREYRCALSAIGDYNTQKVLFLLRAVDATIPAIVVKLTRHPSVNRRLETERDALRLLETYRETIGDRVPRVLFAGRHAGLAVVGESALPGVPFADKTGPGDHDAAAANALDWLTRLGVVSARPAAPAAVAEALGDLHARYVALCRPTAPEAGRLEDAIELVARSSGPFPLVLQHGDPGTWNLLVDETGLVYFLDWENADAAGMPLWDVFYLLRSHAVGTARRAGVRRRLAGVERYLFGTSPLSDSIVGAVGGYASKLGIDPALVEPLFHLCWMQQALKEATRTDPARVRDGHYNRLLRIGLERRTAPTLQRVFSGDGR
jgi:hypothetical protein